jgi:Reverse transcriptase (RNA-dependent DNA polymerase)
MPVAIPNFEFSYRSKGKPVFVPTSIGRRIGYEVKAEVEANYDFDPIYFHLRRGGHVAAMHHHRDHLFFARIDISRFFYSVSRRRVQSVLDRIGIANARFYAKWSTVANPYGDPPYALPYGFVQSPILASLVVATSQVGDHLIELAGTVGIGVYMDDISLSSNDEGELTKAYQSILATLESDGFQVGADKLRAPAGVIDIFNCNLTHGQTSVRDERIKQFYASGPDQASEDAFIAYCASVEEGNRP